MDKQQKDKSMSKEEYDQFVANIRPETEQFIKKTVQELKQYHAKSQYISVSIKDRNYKG